jgi:c-di-GMP-binding flagellar brake protein YcgR
MGQPAGQKGGNCKVLPACGKALPHAGAIAASLGAASPVFWGRCNRHRPCNSSYTLPSGRSFPLLFEGVTVFEAIRPLLHRLTQPKAIRPLPAVPAGLSWHADEVELLLWHEAHKPVLQIELAERSGIFHSSLMGFDLSADRLLLDALFPAPPVELLAQLPGFQVTLFKQQAVLQLWVCIEERWLCGGKPAWVVKVLEKTYRQDRRQHSRVSFERGHGPIARLQVPMQAQLRASVVNLSRGGALLNIFGKYNHLWQGQGWVPCKIQLSDQALLDTAVQVRAVNYYRSPCQHTQLRVKFAPMAARQQHLLQGFLCAQWDREAQALPSLARPTRPLNNPAAN